VAGVTNSISTGGGPTDDKPTVTLKAPSDPDRVSSFLNIRVADIHAAYEEWSSRGARFLTPPIDRGALPPLIEIPARSDSDDAPIRFGPARYMCAIPTTSWPRTTPFGYLTLWTLT
jgi:hypothetical protein